MGSETFLERIPAAPFNDMSDETPTETQTISTEEVGSVESVLGDGTPVEEVFFKAPIPVVETPIAETLQATEVAAASPKQGKE